MGPNPIEDEIRAYTKEHGKTQGADGHRQAKERGSQRKPTLLTGLS